MASHLYIPTQSEIDHATEAMTVAYSGDAGRIKRAAQLLAAGAVNYVSQGIGWTVDSQRSLAKQDPDAPEPTRYMVTRTSCQCYDFLNRASAVGQCGDQTVVVNAACKHVLAVQLYMRILAAKLDAAIRDEAGPIYAVEMRDNLYGVFDRQTDVAICGAVYCVRSDTYRPEQSQDAADFSRWLVAQPTATEAADWFPGGMLERVLRGAPDKVTLRADVAYGSARQYTLSGYRYDGGTWVTLEYGDRQQFNELAWANVLQACGFVMPGRPVKQAGLSYHYMLERGTAADGDGGPVHYGLKAASYEYIEQQRVRKMFDGAQASE